MAKNTGERSAKIICLVSPSSQKIDLTESVLEAVTIDRDIVNVTTERIRDSSMNY